MTLTVEPNCNDVQESDKFYFQIIHIIEIVPKPAK